MSLADIPMIAALKNGTMSWADAVDMDIPLNYMPEVVHVWEPSPEQIAAAEVVDESEPRVLNEDWDYERPRLFARKDIWENFPVSCIPLGRGEDGADRHAIVWHTFNLAMWRETKTTDYFEAMDYAAITESRLMKALGKCRKWTVEPALNEGQICVIRMNFDAAKAPAAPLTLETGSEIPTLTRLMDIKAHFPVVWRETPSKSANKIYAIEIFNKQLREMSTAAGRDLTTEVTDRLMAALKMSTSWRVLRAEGRELCRIECA
jgi:hypothetical protein